MANTYLEGTYSEVYPNISPDADGHASGSSGSSPSPAASPATSRPRRPARSTRAASSATRSSHAYGAAFDNPDLIVACVVGDGEAETGPLADQLALQQVPQPGARRRRAADPAPQRLQDRQPDRAGAHPARRARQPAARLRLQAVLRRGRRPARHAPADGRDARPASSTRSPRSRRDARAKRRHRAAALADDRAAHAQGLDRPEGGRRPAGRGHLARAPGAARRAARATRAPRAARGAGCAATGPRSCSTRTARSCPSSPALAPDGRPPHGRQPARQRRPAAARPAAARLPRLRRRRSPRPARTMREATRVLGELPARRDASSTRRSATSASFGPDETASNRLGAVFEATDRAWTAEILPGDEHLAPDGRVMEMLSEHTVPGLARGLPAHRPARPLHLLRGVHPHHRLDVQPARQVAEGHAQASPGGGRSPRSTTC